MDEPRPLSSAALLRALRDEGPLPVPVLAERFGKAATRVLPELLHELKVAGLATSTRRKAGEVWRVTPRLEAVQASLRLSLRALEADQVSRREARDVEQVAATLEHLLAPVPYRAALLASLRELAACLRAGCHIAVLGLAGRVLEISLKVRSLADGRPVDDDAPLAALLARIDEPEASLRTVCALIAQARSAAVRPAIDVPVPTRAQAAMAVHATLEAVRVAFLARR
jgi:hypothetical protein